MMKTAAMVSTSQQNIDEFDRSYEPGLRALNSQPGSRHLVSHEGTKRSLAPSGNCGAMRSDHRDTPVRELRLPFMGLIQGKSSKKMAVPRWDQLPELAKTELGSRNFHRHWYEDRRRKDKERLTVLNLYVKMRGLGLWDYVTHRDKKCESSLNFRSASLEDLKAKLQERDDFTTPDESSTQWQSREKRARGSLHIKHWGAFTEAHIDPFGARFKSNWWWAMPLIPIGLAVIHGLFDYSGYENPYRIRDILLSQGWWKEPLLGEGVASPYSGKRNTGAAIEPPEAIRLEMGSLQHQGQPMNDETRRPYESYFNHDFSRVRVHTDEKFSGIARSLGLEAFTIGNAIVFGPGNYAPHLPRGKALMAHELAHVRQQTPNDSLKPSHASAAQAGTHQAESEAETAEIGYTGMQSIVSTSAPEWGECQTHTDESLLNDEAHRNGSGRWND